jgi:hypothetical protein
MFQFISARGFWFTYIKLLYFFTGTGEKISPGMNEVIVVKSLHVTHFYTEMKFLYSRRDQDYKIINISILLHWLIN